jgi:NADH-quinone oxidoreductase subunit J
MTWSADLVFFLGLAVVAIATGVGMLLSRSAVYSALFLVLNFGTVAGFYLYLNAPFIAMAQVTVYAGAIMVLFLFVIMLLGVEKLQPAPGLIWQRVLAVLLAGVLLLEAGYLLFVRNAATGLIAAPVSEVGGPQAIGKLLFTDYLLPFEVTSILLLTAMIGAIVLVHTRRGGQK